jgi:two-component system, OmpR family, response regulator
LDEVRHVLLVEDDDAQAGLARTFLRAYGIEVAHARTIQDTWTLLDSMPFDALMVSARGGETDRILGLEGGADDYLAKPFNPHELLARVKALHRRSARREKRGAGRSAVFGPWTLRLAAYRLEHSSGRVCDLTSGELALLRALLENAGKVLSRNQLLALTRHDDGDVFDRTIDSLVVRLRKKIEEDPRKPQLIQTVRGGGYRLIGEVAWRES